MPTRISLVMTVYNTQNYLAFAIDSILAQTYHDWDLIVWDDGSTDRSPEIAREYVRLDPRITFIPAVHQGRTPALIAAIAAAGRNPYLAFIDSDDAIAPNTLAATAAILDRHPDIGLVYSDYLVIDTQNQILGLGNRCNIPYSKERLLIDFMTFHFRLLRRELYERVGGIDLNFRSAEDYDLCLKLSEVTTIYHLSQPLYYYRFHQSSISQSSQPEQIEYSVQAIRNALIRRNLADRYQLNVTANGQFQLCHKAPQSSPGKPIYTQNNLSDTSLDCSVVVLEKGREIITSVFRHQQYQDRSKPVDSLPLVSCLMVTKNRLELAKKAIFCFLQQTYPHKELVIIDDAQGRELADFIEQYPNPQITYYHLPSQSQTLGELRNIAINKATGTYVAQWDDDDLCDPIRLELQMSIIDAFKVDACFLDSLYVWWPQRQLLAKSFQRLWEGTVVCRKDIFPIYPDLRRGEDTEVTMLLTKNYRIAAVNRPELYVYVCHHTNTWSNEHFDLHWQGAQVQLKGSDYTDMLNKLAQRLPIDYYLKSLASLACLSTSNP